jgi:hypothetical protein
MAKKLGPGKCVHCLKDVEERNSDHVFPASWYPDSTPPDLEKWQIPSCIPCNSGYGKLENDFLIKVGLCLDPNDLASKSIVETSLRALTAAAGRNPRDAQHRLNKSPTIDRIQRSFPINPAKAHKCSRLLLLPNMFEAVLLRVQIAPRLSAHETTLDEGGTRCSPRPNIHQRGAQIHAYKRCWLRIPSLQYEKAQWVIGLHSPLRPLPL